MENIAIQYDESQEKNNNNVSENVEDFVPSSKEFFDMLEEKVRQLARITIIDTIEDEFGKFIGAAPYKRIKERNDYRNGVRYRDFETRFGVIKDIPIPRARKESFIPKLFDRWSRREHKITRAIADLFINGISTRKVKKITNAIWGRNYSAATVSKCNKVLQQDYLNWMNRPINQSIRYLFLDGINLKVRRHPAHAGRIITLCHWNYRTW